MSTYADRNSILRTLGFGSYADYLYSDLWEWVRSRAIGRNGGRCYCCDRKAECIHHFKYTHENLSGRALNWLMPLCKRCHNHGETYKDGSKVWELEKVNERLGVLRAWYRRPTKDRARTDDPWQEEQNRRVQAKYEAREGKRIAKSARKKMKNANRVFIEALTINGGMRKDSIVRLGLSYPLKKDWKDRLIGCGILLSKSTPEEIRKAAHL